MFLIFPDIFHEKMKRKILEHFFTPHINWYTHTYFCSKMAINIVISNPVSKPKNVAKDDYFTSNLISKYKDFD